MRLAGLAVSLLLAATTGCGRTPTERLLRAEVLRREGAGDPPVHVAGAWSVYRDGSLALDYPDNPRVLPPEGDRFRAVVPEATTASALAMTDRGRLHRVVGSEVEDVGVRVQRGSRIVAGTGRTWFGGEAGGLGSLASRARTLVPHWETGDPPVSALAARGGRLLVGRVTGTLEAGWEEDRQKRRKLIDLDGPVSALALSRDLRAAAADRTGKVCVEDAREGRVRTWSARGPVIFLAFAEPASEVGGDSVLVALKEDGDILAGPTHEDGSAVLVVSLGVPVRTATIAASVPRMESSVVPRLVLRILGDAIDCVVTIGPPLR